jgi:hypothetical protein
MMEKRSSHKYVELWQQVLPEILEFLEDEENEELELPLKEEIFVAVGNRVNSGYTFRLDIFNGVVPTKDGSAVARDLKAVLDDNTKFNEYAAGKYIVIRLDKKFVMHILIHYN